MPRPSPATSQAYQKLQAGKNTTTFPLTPAQTANQIGSRRAAPPQRTREGSSRPSWQFFWPQKTQKDGKILPGIRHLLSLVLSSIPRAMPPLRALRVKPPGCQGRAKTRSEKVGCRLVAAKRAPGMTDRCILCSGHFRLPHICRYLGGGAAEHPRQVRRSAE
ncbi:hypothetical protein HDV57DRAFT_448121 [Trichoderma longibrachiatum]|uniref:Uncharacterized protein n=1 Tax=Trichoderma longibrachiatum ATCC 18648 TaxID=983965 RepID=A0A2T4CGE6_TRILO|nr:hypothetical protein M440DRAFT_1130643 [Trichoderma longibrachiatum ATCC 18648]